tara:strand:+ start:227 stop:877 length:651 start_codon:yes stop_codon:yes gene_type:complete
MEEQMQIPVGSVEAKDDFAVAPPGHSLVDDNEKWAWGKPPQLVDPEQALEDAIEGLKKPKVQTEMQKLLFGGVSIEVMVEGYILQSFHEGKFTPDVGLLIKPPLTMYIANMAEEEGIPYRMFENQDAGEEGVMDDKSFFSMMKQNNPRMFEFIRENVNESIREGNLPEEEEESNFMNMEASPLAPAVADVSEEQMLAEIMPQESVGEEPLVEEEMI